MFQPDPGEVDYSGPDVPPADSASEDTAQVTTQEASAGQTPAAPEIPDNRPVTVPYPPGEEPPEQTQDTAAPAADADTGAAPADAGVPIDVLVAAGQAGLTAEDVQALGSADAIKAAIRIKGGGQVAPTTATPAGKPEAQDKTAPVAPPELKPWELDLPKEFEDADRFDPKVVEFLRNLTAGVKARDEAYRARVDYLEKRQPQGESATADRTSEMMFDMTLNQKLAEEAFKPYVEKLGIGWQAELSEEEFANRQKVAVVASELITRQQSQGRRPKLGEIAMQAAGIVFPEIASKLGQKAIASKIAARPKVGKPGGVADSRNPRQQAIDDIREIQRSIGVR